MALLKQCVHSWDGMIKSSKETTASTELRRCPNKFCPLNYYETRITKKGWFNIGAVGAAVASLLAAVVIAIDDDTPPPTS
jgi:hypothetical protein